MNLIYFKSDIGNFGDDLNLWLWNELFGDFKSYPSDIDFVGIGSILDERILTNRLNKKVVFGAGVRDYKFNYKAEDQLDIMFVRGPISSKVTKNSPFITDAAYCLRLLDFNPIENKKYKISYVPYFRNYYNYNWSLFQKYLGIHVINPTGNYLKVIEEIRSSDFILSSAMHGAIIADIFRVPWMRVNFNKMGKENKITSELKWKDWAQSICIEKIPTHNFDFNLNEKTNFLNQIIYLNKFYKIFKNNTFVNSKNDVISRIDDKLYTFTEVFKNKYKI
jgi:succinoglycan biosynthesis protein ExoV